MHSRILIAMLVGSLLAVGARGAAEEISTEACLACHGNEGFVSPTDGRSLFTAAEAFSASVHGALPCTACHTDIVEIPHPEKLKPVGLEACAVCHSDMVAAYQASTHGQAHARGVQQAATCQDCHGNVHAARPHSDPASAAHWSQLAGTCARCHANIALMREFHIPVVRPVEAYLNSAHARAVAAGRHGAVCSDCHGAHDILPSADARSATMRSNIPATCGKCHQAVLAAYRASVHGQAVEQGHRDAPVCTDCHGEHQILSAGDPNSPVFAANIPRETCGRCHANERLNEKYGIGAGKVSAFEDSFHGLALHAGKLTVANCASCHGVHDILSASDPRSHVNPANLAATCGKCHPGAGTSFAIGSVHGTPTSTNTRAVSWVRFIYSWLIGLTIGFMALHNLLDLRGKARRPAPPLERTPLVNAPQRMTRPLRWQHGIIMLSFPVLVYTGFALKYPTSWWATPLLRWETQLGLRGVIHRIAAVLMIVGVVWHLTQLTISHRLRVCMRAMLPAPRDIGIAVGTFAYYLGWRLHPPQSGRFNYAEKAEYWAFMWGTAVMTATGFLLWFENLTLRYLPSWVPDVATAVHFYEAILATLSILVWHLYWVIFDPEVYPMDWTWWDGYSPPARVHERSEAADENDVGAGPSSNK